MVEFLNLFLNKIIGPGTSKAIGVYETLKLDPPIWSSIEVNSISDGQPTLFKSIDVKTNENFFNFRIHFNSNKKLHQIWLNNKIKFSKQAQETNMLDHSYNSLIDQIISFEIRKFQTTLNESIGKYSKNSFEDNVDDKTLEWLRVSFLILEKAIIESFTNNELLFSIKLYIGKNPNTNLTEIRALIFNLDICYRLTENGLLEIIIYDDKNQKQNSSNSPVLRTTTFNKSRECLDQLVTILSLCSKGIKIT